MLIIKLLPVPKLPSPMEVHAAQTFTLRLWDDASLEGDETIELTYAISGTTDATAGAFNQSFNFNDF